MLKKSFIITLGILLLFSQSSFVLAEEVEAPSKSNKWNYNYCRGINIWNVYNANKMELIKDNEKESVYKEKYDDEYAFNEEEVYREIARDRNEGDFIFRADEPFVAQIPQDTFGSIGCTINSQPSYFEIWAKTQPKEEGVGSLFFWVNPKTWEIEIYNNKYIDKRYPDEDYSYGNSMTFDLIIQRDIPSSETWDDGRVDTVFRKITFEPEESIKFKIHDDPMGGVTITEANFEDEFMSEFKRSVRSHGHLVEFPKVKLNKEMSNIVWQPNVPRMTKSPKLEVSYNERQEDGSTKEVKKSIEGKDVVSPDRIITYIDINTRISDLMEEAGRVEVETEVLGDSNLVPKDLKLKFYIDDHLQKTLNWNEVKGTSLLLNDLSVGTHVVKMENYSESNGGAIWTTQDNFELKKDHSNKLYFTDIDELHPLFYKILAAVKQGWINGYPDFSFKPDDSVNRAEFAKMLSIAFKKGNGDGKNLSKFPDVDLGQWYKPYLSKAVELKMMAGYPDGKMRPGNSINKAEALKMTLELIGKQENEVPKNSQWYEKYRRYAEKNFDLGFLSIEDMSQDMTRGECVELILEALGDLDVG